MFDGRQDDRSWPAYLVVLRHPDARSAGRALARVADSVARGVFDLDGVAAVRPARRGRPRIRHGLPATAEQRAEHSLGAVNALLGVVVAPDPRLVQWWPRCRLPASALLPVCASLTRPSTAVALAVGDPLPVTLAELLGGPGTALIATTMPEPEAGMLRAALDHRARAGD